jgi:nicotinamide-nucleotide amidase
MIANNLATSFASPLIDTLNERGESVATAESLTGGLVSVALTEIPGASRVFRGGVVAYTIESKISLLGIERGLIDQYGVVSEEVAKAMASAVQERFASTWGIATTGVAGPGAHDGTPAGEVWIAISGPKNVSERLALGDLGRSEVRNGAVTGALALLSRILRAG